MKKIALYIFTFMILASSIIGQESSPATTKKENTWKTLSRITYKKEFDELMGFKIDKPVFSDRVKALEGKEVIIKGYIIPVEGYKSHKNLSYLHIHIICVFSVVEQVQKRLWKSKPKNL